MFRRGFKSVKEGLNKFQAVLRQQTKKKLPTLLPSGMDWCSSVVVVAGWLDLLRHLKLTVISLNRDPSMVWCPQQNFQLLVG